MNERRPWRFLVGCFLALALVTSAVPIVAWMQRPTGTVYTGESYESGGDLFVYLNLIEQAKRGAWTFTDFFTPELHQQGFVVLPFLVAGKIAAVLHLSALWAWHVMRLLMLPWAMWMLWRVVERMFAGSTMRKFGYLMVLFAGDVAFPYHSSSTFTTLLYSPMEIATIALSCWFLLLVYDSFQHGWTWKSGTGAVLLAVTQAFTQPYVLFLWMMVPLVYGVVVFNLHKQRRIDAIIHTTVPVCVSALAMLLLYIETATNPVLAAWSANAMNFHHVPYTYLPLFFGALTPLFVVGLYAIARQLRITQFRLFMVAWLFVGMCSVYSPYPYGYRLFLLLGIPATVIATEGVVFIWRYVHAQRWLYGIAFLCVGLLISGNVRNLVTNLRPRVFINTSGWYISAEFSRGLTTMRDTLSNDAIVLHDWRWDTIVAQRTHHYVFTSGGWQTATYREGKSISDAIYSGQVSTQHLRVLIQQYGITDIVWSDRERANHPHTTFRPDEIAYLHKTYDADGFTVYHVQ